ncbi:MAG: PqqD family protein [Tissierellaceae bacterium]|jgi:hypothetical protein|nr:PqqD family protein [Tissierellaceae bacterium]
MNLNKHIIYRFESKILNGKTFIFNLDTQDIFLSDEIAFDVLRLIDKEQVDADEIINRINNTYNIDATNKIYEFLDELRRRKVIVEWPDNKKYLKIQMDSFYKLKEGR